MDLEWPHACATPAQRPRSRQRGFILIGGYLFIHRLTGLEWLDPGEEFGLDEAPRSYIYDWAALRPLSQSAQSLYAARTIAGQLRGAERQVLFAGRCRSVVLQHQDLGVRSTRWRESALRRS